MSLPLLLMAVALVQNGDAAAAPKLPPAAPGSAPAPQEQSPPEEDESLAPKEYAFNPIQAAKEIRTGDFYWKKGKYKAAVARYREATRWNNQSAEAFRKLGEAEEKQEEPKLAKEAFEQALSLGPDPKEAGEIRKHLQKLR